MNGLGTRIWHPLQILQGRMTSSKTWQGKRAWDRDHLTHHILWCLNKRFCCCCCTPYSLITGVTSYTFFSKHHGKLDFVLVRWHRFLCGLHEVIVIFAVDTLPALRCVWFLPDLSPCDHLPDKTVRNLRYQHCFAQVYQESHRMPWSCPV